MNDKKKERLKKNLVDAELMEPTDTILDYLQTNYREKLLGKVGQWKQGWGYFTEERFICVAGLFTQAVVVPYKNIRELGKCKQGLFPMGITITFEHHQTKELMTESFSLQKREKWLDFLSEKSGVEHP